MNELAGSLTHTRMRKIIVILGLVLIALASFIAYGKYLRERQQPSMTDCYKLPLGSSRGKIRSIMGKPGQVKFLAWDSITTEIWLYEYDAGITYTRAESRIECRLDSARGVLIEKICGTFRPKEID